MKKFDNLTTHQQNQALDFATKEFEACLEMGLIEPLTTDELKRYAVLAVEGSLYKDNGERVRLSSV